MSDSVEYSLRTAVEDDLPLMAALSAASGQAIVPGGGDFVTMAWAGWWKQDPQMHYNQWVINADVGVGFARIELYGTPEVPESGWLEGLRVHSESQGTGVMKKLLGTLMQRVPELVHKDVLLAVGSGNDKMCPIADKKYTYIGAQVAFSCPPAAEVTSPVHKCVRRVQIAEAEELFTWMSALTAYNSSRLLLPARFYAFRVCTLAALKEKIGAGRVYAAFDVGPGDHVCLGIFFTFDTDLDHGGSLMRWHTCCFADGLSQENVTSVLHAWAEKLPAVDEAGSKMMNILSVGPAQNTGGNPDVEPCVQAALEALSFKRNLSTHLRLYRM